MNSTVKTILIIVAIVLAQVLLATGIVFSINNRAISLEEQISVSRASINVQEKRRVDLIFNLIDTVQSYQEYEGQFIESFAKARDIQPEYADGAMAMVNAVAESYPELKADAHYQQLMTELALTENTIAQYRNYYNDQIKDYNKFVRSFPNSTVLEWLRYSIIDISYTEFNSPVDAPQDLFGDK